MLLSCPVCGISFEGKGSTKYCSKKCYLQAKTRRIHPKINKVCPVCGKEFISQTRSDQIYCSFDCKDKSRGLKNERKERYFCATCGKEYFPKKRIQKYCSNKCARAKQHDLSRFSGNREAILQRDGKKCTRCGATIGLNVHHADRTGQISNRNDDPENLITLCDACHKLEHSETFEARRKRRKVKCQQCGKEYEVKESQIKRGRGKFCSKACYNKSMENSIEITCQGCGKPFKVWPTRLRNGKQVKFCSNKCRYRKTG